MTSVIEDPTTVQVSHSSSDFITQSESIGTSFTSDLGASDMASSETSLTDSTIPDTIITGTTATDTATIDTAIADITIVDISISDGAITDTTTTDVTVTDTTFMDTTSLTSSTISLDITTGVTTDITTTTASTATAEASTTSSGEPDTDCIKTNNPYTASNGFAFTLSCNTFINSVLLQDAFLSDFISCLQACSEAQACMGVSYLRDSFVGFYYYYLASYSFPGSRDDDDYWDVAIKDPVMIDTTTGAAGTETSDTTTADTTTADTTTADAPADDTTTSAAPTETSGISTFQGLSSPLQVGDDTYDIFCNGFRFLTESTVFITASFFDCIQACSQNNNCLGVDYVKPNLRCYLAFAFYSEDLTRRMDTISHSDRGLKTSAWRNICYLYTTFILMQVGTSLK